VLARGRDDADSDEVADGSSRGCEDGVRLLHPGKRGAPLAIHGAGSRIVVMSDVAETSMDKESRTALRDLCGLEPEPATLRWFTRISRDIPKADERARFCGKLELSANRETRS
jgi:hypothetical protein